jgi:hypothetical protein
MRRSNRQFHAAAASNRTNSDKTFSQRRSKMKRVLRKENMLLIATLLNLFMPILYIYRNDNLENDEGRSTIMGEKNETNHEAARDANNEVDYTHSGMWDILDCEEIFESERPINSHSTWKHARTLYRGIVGEESSIGDTDEIFRSSRSKTVSTQG